MKRFNILDVLMDCCSASRIYFLEWMTENEQLNIAEKQIFLHILSCAQDGFLVTLAQIATNVSKNFQKQ